MRLPPTFEALYLEKLNMDGTRFGDKSLFRMMLIVTKKAIPRKRFRTEVPKVEDWTEIMHNIYTMEKLTFSLGLEMDNFEMIWEKWIELRTRIRSDFVYLN